VHGCVVQSLHVVFSETLGRRRLCLPFQSSPRPRQSLEIKHGVLLDGILNTSVGVLARCACSTWSKLTGGIYGRTDSFSTFSLVLPLHVCLAGWRQNLMELKTIPLVTCM
jgi:hypothetical protein